jgi:hypothetical protein
VPIPFLVELYLDSVFWYGIGWYFLGIFLTDTKGKFGKDLWYCTFRGNYHKPPIYVPYKGTYVPYDGTFGASDQGQTLDV